MKTGRQWEYVDADREIDAAPELIVERARITEPAYIELKGNQTRSVKRRNETICEIREDVDPRLLAYELECFITTDWTLDVA